MSFDGVDLEIAFEKDPDQVTRLARFVGIGESTPLECLRALKAYVLWADLIPYVYEGEGDQ